MHDLPLIARPAPACRRPCLQYVSCTVLQVLLGYLWVHRLAHGFLIWCAQYGLGLTFPG
jgi:hypothetical protein